MIFISYVPWLFALIGLLVYALTTHKSVGLILLGCGTLVGLMSVAQHVVKF